MMRLRIALWFVALALLTACSSSTAGRVPPQSSLNPLPAQYRIQPGDQLDVKLFYNPELNEQLTVRPDGRITMQLVNDVMAAGLTPAELTAVLTKAYAAELANPKVAVIVRASVADKAYVDGEVFKAGLVPLPGPTTLLQCISQAGGMKESAKRDEVLLLRRGDDGKMAGSKVDVKRVLEGAEQDVMVRPNDIIFVPRSTIANVNVWIDQYLRKNVPLPIGIGYSF